MIHSNVIIVGGGPAGSTCAWKLRQQGVECLILDKQTFPRLKLCAGWITPDVLRHLQLSPEEYPHLLTSLQRMRVYTKFGTIALNTRQYAIRRIEFDAWLLQRSGAPVRQHNARQIRRDGARYVIDGQYSCDYLVGAGGTYCPVYRELFKAEHPRPKHTFVVTLEQELSSPVQDRDCHIWFFVRGLPGYAWYVPKGDNCINIGIGGLVEKLRSRRVSITQHWEWFVQELERHFLFENSSLKPGGCVYFRRDRRDCVQQDRVFLIGDAAGFATRDLAEGIGPAVKSGILAAEAIVRGTPFAANKVEAFSLFNWRTLRGVLFP